MNKITCTHYNELYISVEEHDNLPVVKIDFDIKTYRLLIDKKGWSLHNFPENAQIEDKLYLNENLKDVLLNSLKVFVEHGYPVTETLTVGDSTYTSSSLGFEPIEFKDIYGNEIKLTPSSSAEREAIWLSGSNDPEVYILDGNKKVKYIYPEAKSVLIANSLHLTRDLAEEIVHSIEKQWQAYMLDKNLTNKNNSKLKNKI